MELAEKMLALAVERAELLAERADNDWELLALDASGLVHSILGLEAGLGKLEECLEQTSSESKQVTCIFARPKMFFFEFS